MITAPGRHKQPQRIRARSFRFRKPVRQQNQRRREHAALGHSQQQPQNQHLVIRPREPASDGAHRPEHQQHTDKFLRAPIFRQVPARDLQRQVSPVKNSSHVPSLRRVQPQIATDPRQRQRNIRPVDKRNRVHHQRHRNNPQPPPRNPFARTRLSHRCRHGHGLGLYHRPPRRRTALPCTILEPQQSNPCCRDMLRKHLRHDFSPLTQAIASLHRLGLRHRSSPPLVACVSASGPAFTSFFAGDVLPHDQSVSVGPDPPAFCEADELFDSQLDRISNSRSSSGDPGRLRALCVYN